MTSSAIPISQADRPIVVPTAYVGSPTAQEPKAGSNAAAAGFQPQVLSQGPAATAPFPFRSQYPQAMAAPRQAPIPPAMPNQSYPYYMIQGGSAPLNMGHLSAALPKPPSAAVAAAVAAAASPLHQPMASNYYATRPGRASFSMPANTGPPLQHPSGLTNSHMGAHPGYQPGYAPYPGMPPPPQPQHMLIPSQPPTSAPPMGYYIPGQMPNAQMTPFSDSSYASPQEIVHPPGVGGYFGLNGHTPSTPSEYPHEGANQPVVPRGPPRKPRQSGHAIWVGNLPPGACVVDLKDHFSREATHDIESVKLISKSNCAFVNYKTQAACNAAMSRFHDSRFHGTRLVCRLRKSSIPTQHSGLGTLAQMGVSSDVPVPEEAVSLTPSPPAPEDSSHDQPDATAISTAAAAAIAPNGQPETATVPARFFILKSLTLQDLETSMRNGFWATQAHNEEALNDAYKNAENVYLVFSANKSGEYFGYARMASPIPAPDVDLAQISLPSAQEPVSIPYSGYVEYGPRSIPTPATEWAPKGRIINDSARGTIFWEADEDQTDVPDEASPPSVAAAPQDQSPPPPPPPPQPDKTPPPPILPPSESDQADYPIIVRSPTESKKPAAEETNFTSAAPPAQAPPAPPTPPQFPTRRASSSPPAEEKDQVYAHGNPFRIEWISTRKVPFYRTRGLRNPWNANREIKIARDGTEIEPSVGKKLLVLFGAGMH